MQSPFQAPQAPSIIS